MKTETISGGLLAMAAAVFTASTASAGPASYHPGCPAPPRKVETTSGLVKGHPAEGAESVSEFLGIPYAQPPVDELRWRPPVPYTGKSTINGTDYVSWDNLMLLRHCDMGLTGSSSSLLLHRASLAGSLLRGASAQKPLNSSAFLNRQAWYSEVCARRASKARIA